MKNNYIELSLAEIQMAAFVAVQRTVENLKNGAKHKYGMKEEHGWQMSIEGALGECALAKFLNVYWSKGTIGAPDVWNVDVRTTPYPTGSLLLHDSDPDDRKFFLLTGINGKYTVQGYIYGREGKQQKYWRNDSRPCFWIPQSDLKPYHPLDD